MKIKAISAFTAYDEGRMKVFNEGDEGDVTDALAQDYIDAGKAARVKDKSHLDHDNNGKAGGSTGNDAVLAEQAGFTLVGIGGGWYVISGADGVQVDKLQGKAEAAQARFDEIVAAAEKPMTAEELAAITAPLRDEQGNPINPPAGDVNDPPGSIGHGSESGADDGKAGGSTEDGADQSGEEIPPV